MLIYDKNVLRSCKFKKSDELERRILDFLEERVGDNSAEMYLGGYGNFDTFAYDCCKKYKATHSNISLVFVTPYLTAEYQQKHLKYQKTRYDSIVYPDLEKKPPKFAILYRNKYMIEKADYVLAYVSHDWAERTRLISTQKEREKKF